VEAGKQKSVGRDACNNEEWEGGTIPENKITVRAVELRSCLNYTGIN
jgi:hypothetical protein